MQVLEARSITSDLFPTSSPSHTNANTSTASSVPVAVVATAAAQAVKGSAMNAAIANGDAGPSAHRNQYGSTIADRGALPSENHVGGGLSGYDGQQHASSSRLPSDYQKQSSKEPSPIKQNNGSTLSPSQTEMPTTAASLMREGPRDFTVIRDVGDGSFGTVCLADWKSPLPSGTMLSPMQHPTTRPEYVGKRLVAIKKMKKPFPNWSECMKLKELKSLLAIPHHPNIIPLYDAFLMPGSKELHFVFECMEGNLYQLTKSRKGRPLAGGLVASIFQQIVKGLHHIHQHGYFHRDMKPENLLITTTGLADYPTASPLAMPGTPPEKDVLVIVKLADFGLARETLSKPPYTEYVSTRWYRAPEVLLRSRDYSNPVDLWALGTILAEIVNLKPLFPGQSEVDQVLQICDVIGDPLHDYGNDDRGRKKGGGEWQRGIKMARAVGFEFPVVKPVTFSTLFSSKIPSSLVDCIQDLLRYDPRARMTTDDLLNHYYFTTLAPRLQPPQAKAMVAATTPEQQASMMRQMPKANLQSLASISSLANVDAASIRRAIPPSHSTISQLQKVPFGAGPQPIAANHQQKLLPIRAPPQQQSDGDIAMDSASPLIHGSSDRGDEIATLMVNHRNSSVSQYPAFPESASTYSRLSAIGSTQNNNGDVAMMSPAHYPGNNNNLSSVTRIDRQGSNSFSSHERRLDGEAAQSYESYGQSPTSAAAHQHNMMHGLVSPHPGSTHSSGEFVGGRDQAETSNETLSSGKDAIKKKGGKGWGLNISSVLGGGNNAGDRGAGKSAFSSSTNSSGQQQQNQQSWQGNQTTSSIPTSISASSITPAQQIIADHAQAQQPVKATDPKKAKKEAEKAAREAEKAKRAAQEQAARERARAVMQKRNQILASSNARDQVEWLQLADNDMTKALQAQQAQQQVQQQAQQQQAQQQYLHSLGTGRPSLQSQQLQHEQQYGTHPQIIHQNNNLVGQLSQYPGPINPTVHSYETPLSEKAWGKQPRHTHTSNSDHSNLSGRLGAGSYSPSPVGMNNAGRGRVRPRDAEDDVLAENDPRRQSMQSYHTRDSDPGPMRNAINAYPHSNHRPETTSSLNSAPSIIDAASGRTRYGGAANGGDRSSVDTRSVASSLDNQLILNMENMTAADLSTSTATNSRYRQGSMSPGPVHLVGNRPSFSRQSHGSRTGSAHRAGSASPLHHTAAPRFHPYSSGVVGTASHSNPNMPLPSSAHSPQHGYPLPSLASIANDSGSDVMENLQTDIASTIGPRPRSTRRMSQSQRGLSRGSAASRDGSSLRHATPSTNATLVNLGGTNGAAGNGTNGSSQVNPMFNVSSHQYNQKSFPLTAAHHANYPYSPTAAAQSQPANMAMLLDQSGSTNRQGGQQLNPHNGMTSLPPFSELAARTTSGGGDGYYSTDNAGGGHHSY
ncbi:hypothetical protein L7F22_044186 [Adiantum nelumboides]|nr:hypothetical protein [Adiantum nelumboides]